MLAVGTRAMSVAEAFERDPCPFPGCHGDGLLTYAMRPDPVCGRHYVDLVLAGTTAPAHYRDQLAKALEMRARGRRDVDIAGALGITTTRVASILADPRAYIPAEGAWEARLRERATVPAPAPLELAPDPDDNTIVDSPSPSTVEAPEMAHTDRKCTEVAGCARPTVSDRGVYANVCETHKDIVTERQRRARRTGQDTPTAPVSPPAPSPGPQPAAPELPPTGDGAAGEPLSLEQLGRDVDHARVAYVEALKAVDERERELVEAIDALMTGLGGSSVDALHEALDATAT